MVMAHPTNESLQAQYRSLRPGPCNVGRVIARKFFDGRGNPPDVLTDENELAAIIALAVQVALESAIRKR